MVSHIITAGNFGFYQLFRQLSPGTVGFSYFYRMELSVQGADALDHAVSVLQENFSLGGTAEELAR